VNVHLHCIVSNLKR